MASAKWLRVQAARCVTLAKQTDDEASLQRYRQLAQTYLQLADAEEQGVVQTRAFAGEKERKPAA